jgi:hypothetical protein
VRHARFARIRANRAPGGAMMKKEELDPTTHKVEGTAGAMLFDPDDPWRVTALTDKPTMASETADEREGIVSHVVLPAGIEPVDAMRYVLFAMTMPRSVSPDWATAPIRER